MVESGWTLNSILKVCKGNELLASIKQEFHITTYEQLKKEKEKILYKISEIKKGKNEGKYLYHAYKIYFAFKSSQNALNSCTSALNAALKLQNIFNGIVQSTISENLDQIRINLNECNELEDIYKFSKRFEHILPHISSIYKRMLEKSINDCLNSIYTTENSDILIRSLQFLSKIQAESQKEFEEVILNMCNSSLDWIKSQKEKLQSVTTEEAVENILNISWELVELVIKLQNCNPDFKEKIKIIKKLLPQKKINNIFIDNQRKIEYLLADEMISHEKITKSTLIYETLNYMGENIMVKVWKGLYDNNVPICLKSYYHKSNTPCELFRSDFLCTKYLSEMSDVFLQYIGWTSNYVKSSKAKEGCFFYSIITEGYDSTLMDDIITRIGNNQKYKYNEFYKIAQTLLSGFSWLEGEKIHHLDLKPQNILITHDRKIKIAGFNVSKTYGTKDNFSYSNNKIWDDLYIAPEIYNACLESKRDTRIDIRFAEKADIYSLGLIFMQMYSLLSIEELNTPDYYKEIEDYVSLFKPKQVANLLKGMLAIESSQRISFKESLRLFQNEEELKENDIQIHSFEPLKSPTVIESYLAGLKRIDESKLEIIEARGSTSETLPGGVNLDFAKGFYKEKPILFRTFKHLDENKLLPYIEEAKMLEFLTGKHPTCINYFGLAYNKHIHSLSLITELCNRSLMAEITDRQSKNNYFDGNDLKYYFKLLLEGFTKLKQLNIDLNNINPHNILLDPNNNIKITGFVVPETKIISNCKFPENKSNLLQSEEDYLSPEMKQYDGHYQIDIEKSDIYSLGLVFWQMATPLHISRLTIERLQSSENEWILKLLEWMLKKNPSQRTDFANACSLINFIRPDI